MDDQQINSNPASNADENLTEATKLSVPGENAEESIRKSNGDSNLAEAASKAKELEPSTDAPPEGAPEEELADASNVNHSAGQDAEQGG